MGNRKKVIARSVICFWCLVGMIVCGIIYTRSLKRIEEPDTPLAGNVPVSVENLLKTNAKINYIEDCDLSFSNWTSGEYNSKTGMYSSKATSLCLNEYKEINSKSYNVKVSNIPSIIIGVAEFGSNGKFLRSNYLVSGMKYTPKTDVKYIGLYIYSYSKEKMDYNKYKSLFEKGGKIQLESTGLIKQPETQRVEETKEELKNEETKAEETKTEEKATEVVTDTKEETSKADQESSEVLTPAPVLSSAKPVQKTNVELLKDELRAMIESADTTTHNVSTYALTFDEVNNIWNGLKENECKMYLDTDSIFIIPSKDKSTGLVKEVYIFNIDKDYLARHNRMMEVINYLVNAVDKSMSDLDKVIFVHEYLVKTTTYSKTCTKSGSASAILGDKTGMCAGFADAMRIVLGEMGVEVYNVISPSMNHEWNYIKIDGELYQMDVCWDNRYFNRSNDQNWHRYFLRSDSEFQTINKPHTKFWCVQNSSYKATSEKFKNWYVHDVYGQMYYYNGLWYYYDKPTNSIKAADAYGNNMTTIIEGGNSTLKLTNMEGNKISYSLGGVAKTKTM